MNVKSLMSDGLGVKVGKGMGRSVFGQTIGPSERGMVPLRKEQSSSFQDGGSV